MSALTFSKHNAIHHFRDATARQASMPGVTAASFRCVRCKQPRAVAGRKMAVKGWRKGGFVCAGCATE